MSERSFNYGPSPGRILAVWGGALVLSVGSFAVWLAGAGGVALLVAALLAVMGALPFILARPGFRRAGALVLCAEQLQLASAMGPARIEKVGYAATLGLRLRNDNAGNRLKVRHRGGTILIYRDFLDRGPDFDRFLDALNERIQAYPPAP